MLNQINSWREDLINLNRNNRLLYFRKTKSSTLELRLTSAGASELLGRLSNGRGVTFWEPPDDVVEDADEARPERNDEATALFENTEPSGDEFNRGRRPARRTRGPALRADEILCDVAGRQALLKALRWLERRAAQEFMDKGPWVLYLGIGLLDWIEQPRDTGELEKVSSPVVLIPVQLRRESAKTPYQLFRADEDAATNPALAFKLQHDFGITLPPLNAMDDRCNRRW